MASRGLGGLEPIPVPYGTGKEKISLVVGGMTCAACVQHLEHALGNIDGVTSTSVNLATGRATVEYMPAQAAVSDLRNAVEGAGYSFHGVSGDEYGEPVGAAERASLGRKVIFSLAVAGLTMALMAASPIETALPFRVDFLLLVLATPVQFWAGRQFYAGAWGALKQRTSNMNTLIAVGTSVAYLYSVAATFLHGTLLFADYEAATYFDTSTAIIGLVLLGRYLEARAKNRASDAIRSLLRLQPHTSVIRRDGEELELPVDQVLPGDFVLVKPGQRVACDGVVVEGHTWVDESMLTGESAPVEKTAGSQVTGGTLNASGGLTVRAVRTGKDTVLARIVRLVEEAQNSKAPVQRLADLVASYFVPAVVVIAIAVFAVWYLLGPEPSYVYAMLTTVAVLIIACPCALGLATPTAIVVGTAKGAESGILIRNAESLERAHSVQVVALDKTGTLTSGRPTVTDVVAARLSGDSLLALAASAERLSEHPLGEAILSAARKRGLRMSQAKEFSSVTGHGVRASVDGSEVLVGSETLLAQAGIQVGGLCENAARLRAEGKTVVFVASAGRLSGLIAAADTLKPDAREAVDSLRSIGADVVMLTGDNPSAAARIAGEAGIDRYVAEVPPEGKASQVRALQDEGKTVAMVGDGVNDAPALAQADLGVAMGTGTDVAIESADMTLVGGELHSVARGISLSRATMKTIKQNLFWAFAYNIILIPVAAGVLYPVFSVTGMPDALSPILGEFGFLNPILAALAMAISSVTVVANSLRLRSFGTGRKA